jgi:hypothetical protein
MKVPKDSVDRIKAVFGGVDLGDPRRTARLTSTAARVARKPTAALPAAMGSGAALEGAYRLMNNRRIDVGDVFREVAAQTAERCRSVRSVLVLHDTTTCEFRHADPHEIGHLPTGKPGFLLHLGLVLDADEWRRPLGVISLETISREQRSRRGKKKASGPETARWEDRESQRWLRGVTASAEALAECDEVIHVADREGDSYALLAAMVATGQSLVVRVNHARNRTVGDPNDDDVWMPLKDSVEELRGKVDREVPLSERKKRSAPRANKANPPRRARLAYLTFTATTVVLKRPGYLKAPIPPTLTLNLVHFGAQDPPAGEPPV